MYRKANKKLVVYSNPGSPVKIVYKSYYDKNGDIQIKESGKENLRGFINSFKDSVDINVLIKRFMAGDTDVFNKRKAEFMDLTDLPVDYFDMVNKINDAKETFKTLPVDIKAKFNNDPNKFIGEIGSLQWFEKLGANFKKDVVVPEVKEEVIKEEVNNE